MPSICLPKDSVIKICNSSLVMAGKLAQQVRSPVAKSNDMSSIPENHVAEGNSQLL